MPRFTYRGNDRTGTPLEGERDAESPWRLVQALRAEGTVTQSVTALEVPRPSRRSQGPLRLEDLNQFTSQLASLTHSGMPLPQALGELAREVRGRRFRQLLETARREVEGGKSLEEVLERHGDAFPMLYRNLIAVGERTGNLPGVLQQLAAYGQRHLWLRQHLLVAGAYPVFLLVALLLFFGFFVTEVIGQFEFQYGQFGAELPWLTSAALSVGRAVHDFGLPVLGVFGGFAILFALFLRRAPLGSLPRALWERLLLSCPGVGPIYRIVLSARFFRALSILLENGTPIVESLHLAGAATASTRFAAVAVQAASRVAQGEAVSDALQSTGVLQRTHLWMLRQGETSGNFTKVVERLAASCDHEAEQRQRTSLSTLGPGLIAFCGLLVGLAVIASFLPIFQFSTLINR